MKKLLALVLALVMTLGLATVSAGATTFTDDADIDHQEAVEVMNSLNIINGMGDGKFDPNGNVTRAQMAKMVTIALLGDVDVSAFTGTATDLKDVSGHWAEGYIKYCYSQGIISGRGNGVFDPNANVTTAEASKMLLVALGYNSDVRKYTGGQWAINVARDAQMKGLYDEIANLSSNKVMDRDDAAQLIYNTLNAERVIAVEGYNSDGVFTTQYRAPQGDESKTLLEETFDAQVYLGNFAENDKTDDTLKEGMIKLANGHLDSATAGNGTPSFYADLDISYIGEEVKVIFKDAKAGTTDVPDKEDTIYGVYVTGGTKVINTTLNKVDDELSDGKLEIDGSKYKVVNFATKRVVINYGAIETPAASDSWTDLSRKTGDAVKFILNDDDKVSMAYVTLSQLGYVTAVNSEKITIAGLGTIKLADNEVYSGAAKNDIVVFTKLYDATAADAYCIVEKAPVVQGTVKGFSVKKANESSSKVVVDGTTYNIYAEAAMPTTSIDSTAGTAYFTTDDIDETFDLYMLNGYVARAEKTSVSMNEYALVLQRNDGKLDSTFNPAKAELLLADGSKVNVTLHKDSVIYTTAGRALDPNDKLNKTTAIDSTNALDQYTLVKYAKVSDTVYKIEEIGAWRRADGGLTNADVKIYDKDTKAFATNATGTESMTASGATLFVYNTAADATQVYNLRNLNNLTVADNTEFAYVVKDSKIVAAFTTVGTRPSGATANTFYGVVASSDGVEKINDEYYNKYTVVNDKDSKTVYVSDGTLAKKRLVSFDIAADDIYTVGEFGNYDAVGYVKEYNEADKTLTYFTGITGNATVGYEGSGAVTKAVDDKVQILYINGDKTKAGDEIGVGEFDGVTGYRNIAVFMDDGKVAAMIVESSLEADILGYSGYNITINGTVWGTYAVGATVDWDVATNGLKKALPAAYDLATAVTVAGKSWSNQSTNEPTADFAMPAANIVINGEYAITNASDATVGTSNGKFKTTTTNATENYGTNVTVTLNNGDGGAKAADANGKITIKVTNVGGTTTYATKDVTLTSGGAVPAGSTLSFTMPSEAVTVTLTFVAAS